MVKIDEVIELTLVAIYSNDVLNESLYLKGGQALRIAHDMKSRFSADVDFSTKKGFDEDNVFFEYLLNSLYNEFLANDLYLFDFKYVRQPKLKKEETPDFWGGWQVEFKLIEKEKMTMPLNDQRRQALIPVGAESSRIKIDISEYEYCESTEVVKVQSVEVKTYTRVLLVLEKIRAICQQHPDYQIKGVASNRARDYYDIERVYQKVIQQGYKEDFINEASKHLKHVFDAKEVPLKLLDKIFENSFIDLQSRGWSSVETTVIGNTDEFEYYNETLKNIISDLKTKIKI